MRHSRSVLGMGGLLGGVFSAAAAVDAGLVGQWQAGSPGQAVVLQLQADGRCALAGRTGQCATLGTMLVFHSGELTLAYQWALAGATLRLAREGGAPVAFQRVGDGAAAPAPAAVPGPQATPAPAAFRKDAWGLSFSPPPAWRAVERDGQLLVVSDTEAGLMQVQFLPRSSRAELLAGYREGLRDGAFVALPVAEAQPFDAPGGPALAGLMEGRAQDGSVLRVRSIGVLSRFGGAAVVLGVTTPPQFAALQGRVEALARSLVFHGPPPAAPIAGHYQFVHVSKVGSYSREASLTLCASGRFTQRGEMAGSGSAGSAFSAGGGGGSWSASGDASAGTLVLNFSGGGSRSLPYRVSTDPRDRSGWGPALQFGNDTYQKAGDGNC